MTERNLNFSRAWLRTFRIIWAHLQSNPLAKNWLTIVIAVLMVAGYALPNAESWLRYDRALVAQGEMWRIVTSAFAHASPDHLWWNLLTMTAAGIVAERIDRRGFAMTLAVSIVGIGAAAHAFFSYDIVLGASGPASAVFTFILVRFSVMNWRADPWVTVHAMALFVAWGTFELGLWGARGGWQVFTGRSASGLPVHTLSLFHLAGIVTALPVALWPRRVNMTAKAAENY